MDLPLLLPTPRSLRLVGGTSASPTVSEDTQDAGGAEAYRLGVGPNGVQITGLPAGRRHGLATLAQLRRQYGAVLPCLEIADAPAFAVRGVMLDISRDRVWTMAQLELTIAQLAAWKINHLQLYVEHTFAFAGHQEVWGTASPLTPDEVRRLDQVAAGHGIGLVANLNCFGHLERWLKHPRYRPLAEIQPGDHWEAWGQRFERPSSLCPSDPGSAALVADLLAQYLPCFSAPLANLGCDETFDLGWGRSRDEVARRGRAAVYLEFVARVCALARSHGKRPAFWADIALEHPEALGQLPEDLLCLAWGYEADADFARWCRQLRGAGREVWVCPGTSTWCAPTGRTWDRQGNLLAAARQGLAGGASGWLATAWGDRGHHQQWPVELHALAESAHRGWSGTATCDPRALGLHALGVPAAGPWLDQLGDCDLALRRTCEDGGRPVNNQSALFKDLSKPLAQAWGGSAEAWRLAGERVGQAAATLPPGLDPQVERELRHTCRWAAVAARRAVARREQDRPALKDLASCFRDLADEHACLWRLRTRPGGLDDSRAHFLSLADELDRL